MMQPIPSQLAYPDLPTMMTFTDVVPQTIGTIVTGPTKQLDDRRMFAIFEKNTPFPVSKTESFTTTRLNQVYMPNDVIQGESDMANECASIMKDKVMLEVKPKKQILRFTYSIDENGVLDVTAEQIDGHVVKKLTVPRENVNLPREILNELSLQMHEEREENKRNE